MRSKTIMLRLNENEERMLNEGWIKFCSIGDGLPVSRSEYIRACINMAWAELCCGKEAGNAEKKQA